MIIWDIVIIKYESLNIIDYARISKIS